MEKSVAFKMKKLIIINGTMGVGKSTVSRILLKKLKASVYLDGDWCWNMNPFIPSEENKRMVIDNIVYLLSSFLKNSEYRYIIFCWVIPQESIFDQIISGLQQYSFDLYKFTLCCSIKELHKRLQKDIGIGVRSPEIIERSENRLAGYQTMATTKIYTDDLTPEDTAEIILNLLKE